jgi:cobalamin synthase
MAFTPVITIQQPLAQTTKPIDGNNGAAALLAALLLSFYAGQKTKKELNKLKRRAIVELFKHRMKAGFARAKSLFSKKAAPVDNRTLLYILIGLAVLILIFIEPVIALILLLIGILLYLFMNTKS